MTASNKQAQQKTDGPSQSFDDRDFRRALGQFATGVTVVTARTLDGRKLGVTVNSFASVSLEPPLILWSLLLTTPSFADFNRATHFAVNVLGARQHDLSRRFSTSMTDRFSGVDYEEGPHGLPLLKGTIAHFICRNLRQHDGGDHLIFIGQVEEYKYSEGEPLVFHSGRYHITTQHPDVAE